MARMNRCRTIKIFGFMLMGWVGSLIILIVSTYQLADMYSFYLEASGCKFSKFNFT